MSLINIPSMGVVRAGSYYLLLPVICFALPFNIGLLIILMTPVTFTLISGFKKYKSLRLLIVLNFTAQIILTVILSGNYIFSLLALVIIPLPSCVLIALKTKN